MRLSFEAKCYKPAHDIKMNVKKNKRAGHKVVEYATRALHPPCAIVGGGPSLEYMLDKLRSFDGDIFAVNRTAYYLANKGIPCSIFSVDPATTPFDDHVLIKEAFFASRCSPKQFKAFGNKAVMFDNWEEDKKHGVQGGATSVTRMPHLFVRMGYMGAYFVGCDSCLADLKKSHATGNLQHAYQDMIVVRADGIDYVTNAALYLQAEYLSQIITGHPGIFINASSGLLKAMVEHPDDWEAVAVGEDLRRKYQSGGIHGFNKPYKSDHARWALAGA